MGLLPGDEDITHLYKYRNTSECTLKIFENNELHFPFPHEFNDPFDCYVEMNFEGAPEDWYKWIYNQPISKKEKDHLYAYLEKKEFNPDIIQTQKNTNDTKSLIILTLSEVPDNILMWSHYSDNHRGICVGFKTSVEGNSLGLQFDDPALTYPLTGVSKGFLPVSKVHYSVSMPSIYNRLKDEEDKLQEFLKTKHCEWDYEKERRIIYPYSLVNKQEIKFSKSILDKVIFGLKISDSDKNKIFGLVKKYFIDSGFDVRFYQAKMIKGKYAIELIDFNL